MSKKKDIIVFTIGHSTHELEEFIKLLQQYKVTHLIDIRTVPRSRHTPQFNKGMLSRTLKKNNIAYTHMKELGGFRPAQSDSINTAWHNKSFRGFADYMQSDDFKKGIETLVDYAQSDQVAIMCAEAVPWRCHRSLIGDALLVRGIKVKDIFSLTNVKTHKLTAWAKVEDDTITYPESALTK